jgi:hypothetical protein
MDVFQLRIRDQNPWITRIITFLPTLTHHQTIPLTPPHLTKVLLPLILLMENHKRSKTGFIRDMKMEKPWPRILTSGRIIGIMKPWDRTTVLVIPTVIRLVTTIRLRTKILLPQRRVPIPTPIPILVQIRILVLQMPTVVTQMPTVVTQIPTVVLQIPAQIPITILNQVTNVRTMALERIQIRKRLA